MTEFVPLCTMTLDLAPALAIGAGPAADRSVGGIRAATVIGDRLNATLAGPAAGDWLVRINTFDGRSIGRVRFTVKEQAVPPATSLKILK